MSKQDELLEQSPDYSVIHADDLIVQLGSDMCKIIVYQNVTRVTDDGKGIDKQTKHKRLKFEIRVPNKTLENLATTVLTLNYTRQNALKLAQINRDRNTARSWWQVDNTIESSYYDTEHTFLNKSDTNKLIQSFMDLGMRVNDPINKKENEDDESSK